MWYKRPGFGDIADLKAAKGGASVLGGAVDSI
jgi:hypothetical protein